MRIGAERTLEEMSKGRLINLHHNLGHLQTYLSSNRGFMEVEEEGYEAINHVCFIIEKEVVRLNVLIKDANLTTIVEHTFEEASVKVDEHQFDYLNDSRL